VNVRICVGVFAVLLLSGCVSTVSVACGPNDKVIRYDRAQIDEMSDDQVKDNLARNNELERRGCAISN
jgi:outer membrane murein-binding lipoprotein Lpp